MLLTHTFISNFLTGLEDLDSLDDPDAEYQEKTKQSAYHAEISYILVPLTFAPRYQRAYYIPSS